MYDTNFNNSLLEFKEPNTYGNKFAVKVIKNQHQAKPFQSMNSKFMKQFTREYF